jgi:uncharacterized membrane protein YagU involved in acid resistance
MFGFLLTIGCDLFNASLAVFAAVILPLLELVRVGVKTAITYLWSSGLIGFTIVIAMHVFNYAAMASPTLHYDILGSENVYTVVLTEIHLSWMLTLLALSTVETVIVKKNEL